MWDRFGWGMWGGRDTRLRKGVKLQKRVQPIGGEVPGKGGEGKMAFLGWFLHHSACDTEEGAVGRGWQEQRDRDSPWSWDRDSPWSCSPVFLPLQRHSIKVWEEKGKCLKASTPFAPSLHLRGGAGKERKKGKISEFCLCLGDSNSVPLSAGVS